MMLIADAHLIVIWVCVIALVFATERKEQTRVRHFLLWLRNRAHR